MNDYKVALINEDGETLKRGKLGIGFHFIYLLLLGKELYPNMNAFKKEAYEDEAVMLSYLFTSLGNVVFLNTTKNQKKSGIVFIPSDMNEAQKNSLYNVISTLGDAQIEVLTNLNMVDNELKGRERMMDSQEFLERLSNDEFVPVRQIKMPWSDRKSRVYQ